MAGPAKGEVNPGQGEVDIPRTKGRLPLLPEIIRMDEVEVAQRLSIYGPDALIVKSVATNANGRRGIGTFKVEGNPVRHLKGDVVLGSDGIGRYTVAPEDAKDHFYQDQELPEPDPLSPVLFPGVREAIVIREAADAFYKDEEVPPSLYIIRNLKFEKPIGVGTELTVEFSRKDEDTDDGEHVFEAMLKAKGRKAATVELEYSDDGAIHLPGKHVDPELMAESAAQVALVLLQKQRDLKNMDTIMPMFGGIEEIQIFQAIPLGEEVTVDVSFEGEEGLNANARILRADGTVAQVITGIKGPVWPRERGAGYVTRQRI